MSILRPALLTLALIVNAFPVQARSPRPPQAAQEVAQVPVVKETAPAFVTSKAEFRIFAKPDAAKARIEIRGTVDRVEAKALPALNIVKPRMLEAIREVIGTNPEYDGWQEGIHGDYDPQHGRFPNSPWFGWAASHLSFADPDLALSLQSLVTQAYRLKWPRANRTDEPRAGLLSVDVTFKVSPDREEVVQAHREAVDAAWAKANEIALTKGVALSGESRKAEFTDLVQPRTEGWVLTTFVEVDWTVVPSPGDQD